LPDRFGEDIDEEEIFRFLDSRRGKLGGVCISGGEPTLWSDLPDFIAEVRAMGFKIKLDTNGTRPEVIAELISRGLLDYIAMDIKNSAALYPLTVGIADFDITPILRSIAIIRNSGIAHEFRTTLVARLHTPESISAIAEMISFDEKYFLQKFVDSGDLIEDGYTALREEETKKIFELVREKIPTVTLRG
jgi:pyruvate formate lyase activating enzyme